MTTLSTTHLRSGLERRYVYLNPITSQVSSNSLTVRQLCRLLCPSSSSTAATPSRIFTPQLQILGLIDDDNDESISAAGSVNATTRYAPEGWTVAHATPILREVCAQYYYSSCQHQTADDVIMESTTTAPRRVIEGPVTCRQLAHIVSEKFPTNLPSQQRKDSFMIWSPSLDAINANENTLSDNDATEQLSEAVVAANQQTNGSGWKKLEDLLDLQIALQAFDTTPTLAADTITTEANTLANADYDASMIFAVDESINTTRSGFNRKDASTGSERELSIQEELEAFLNTPVAAAGGGKHRDDDNDEDEDENEGYESDGGTHYRKDPTTGEWVEGSLPPKSKSVAKQTKNSDVSTAKTFKENSATPKIATPSPDSITAQLQQQQSKKRKRPKFSAKHAKCWIYVSGLPNDTNEEEVTRFFSKVGIIALEPETQQPKVKLYRYSEEDVTLATTEQGQDSASNLPQVGQLKGDASICYARPESVDLAVQILDEALFRPLTTTSSCTSMDSMVIRVERAKFEQHGETFDERRRRLATSRTKQKVARLAALQAMDWDDEGDVNGRISGGRKGLRIVVLKYVFDPKKVLKRKSGQNKNHNNHDGDANDDEEEENGWESQVERHVRQTCEQFGAVEKITIFSKHHEGVVLVKFVQPSAATEAVQHYNSAHSDEDHQESWKSSGDRKVEASYWDGVTDYTVRDEVKEQQEMERRQDEFGNWLEHQELPEEFQLRVEDVNDNTA